MKRLLNRFGWWLVKRTGGKMVELQPIEINSRDVARAVWREWDDRQARR